MGPVGFPEMFAIFILALLLFGPKKLPELGRTLGKALSEFRRAKNELKSTFESHLQELERETRMTETSKTTTPAPTYSSGYSYPYEEYNPYNAESPEYSAPAQIGGTERIGGTEELRAALPPAEASTAPTDSPAVTGTVARTNGARPLDESVPSAREEHTV